MRLRTALSAAALGVAATMVVAAPAAAAPYVSQDEIVFGDYTWEVQHAGDGDSFAVDDTAFDDGDDSFSDAWDSGYFAVWDDVGPSDFTEFGCANADLSAADADGDRVITCDAETTDLGLVVDGEIRIYGEGDLARYLVTVSNPTTQPISYSWEFYVDYGETSLRATSTLPTLGENNYVDDDLWSYNWDSGTLAALTVWGLPGSSVMHERVDDSSVDDLYVWNDADDGEQNVMAPGGSITLAIFQKVDVAGTIAANEDFTQVVSPASDKVESSPVANPLRSASDSVFSPSATSLAPVNAAAIAAAVAEFSSFDGRLVRGIPDGVQVANWEVVADAEPELAETGSDSAVITTALLVSGSLLALGVGMLVVRRIRRVRTAA